MLQMSFDTSLHIGQHSLFCIISAMDVGDVDVDPLGTCVHFKRFEGTMSQRNMLLIVLSAGPLCVPARVMCLSQTSISIVQGRCRLTFAAWGSSCHGIFLSYLPQSYNRFINAKNGKIDAVLSPKCESSNAFCFGNLNTQSSNFRWSDAALLLLLFVVILSAPSLVRHQLTLCRSYHSLGF